MKSKHLVSPSITPIVVANIIPYITPFNAFRPYHEIEAATESLGDPYGLQHRRAKDTCPEARPVVILPKIVVIIIFAIIVILVLVISI